MTTEAQPRTEEVQDRLEPGKGLASVIVRGFGSSRRKHGDEGHVTEPGPEGDPDPGTGLAR